MSNEGVEQIWPELSQICGFSAAEMLRTFAVMPKEQRQSAQELFRSATCPETIRPVAFTILYMARAELPRAFCILQETHR